MEQLLQKRENNTEQPGGLFSGKVFFVLSVLLGGLLALFFTPMLIFCFTDAGELLPLVLFFLPAAAFFLWCFSKGIDSISLSKRGKIILGVCVGLFLMAAQLRLAKAIYGKIDYDFNSVYFAGQSMAQTGSLGGNPEYFAQFPNNLLLVFVFAFLFKAAWFLGISNLMAVLTGCSLLLVDLSIVLACLCAKKVMGSKAALMTFVLSLPLAVLHYGIVCPYSDTFGMVFPMLLLFLYLYLPKKTSSACAITALMGILAAVGYKIKPQTVIVVIAIALTELFYHKIDKKRLLHMAQRTGCFLLALVLCTAGMNFCARKLTAGSITDEMRESMQTPPTHYLMMGLNPDTGGFWSGEDYAATGSLKTQKEKVAYNLKVSGERLQAMGIVGYGRFLLQKGRRIFHSAYMDMWVRSPYLNTDPLSVAMQDTFSQSSAAQADNFGGGFVVYLQFLQALWIIMLALWILPLFFCRDSYRDKFVAILRLTIMGLTAFQLLFEGGARYRFHQTPVFILLAVYGMCHLPQGLRETKISLQKRFGKKADRKATEAEPPEIAEAE